MPLGVGGSANVYLARDYSETKAPRLIALKILPSSHEAKRLSRDVF